MIELLSNITALVFAAIGAAVAVMGDTWHKKEKGFNKLTAIGWVAVVSLLVAMTAGITKEIASVSRAAAEAEAQKKEHAETLIKIGEVESSFGDLVRGNLKELGEKDLRIRELEQQLEERSRPKIVLSKTILLDFSERSVVQIDLQPGDKIQYKMSRSGHVEYRQKKLGFAKIKVPVVTSRLPEGVLVQIGDKDFPLTKPEGQFDVGAVAKNLAITFKKQKTEVPAKLSLTILRE